MTQKDDMTGNDIYHRLEAYVDGETSPEEKREIERCLQESEACQARVDELRALSGAVRDESSADKAPADLWARIEERLPAASESAGVIRPAAWWHDRMRPLALAASVVLALGIGGGVAWWQGQIDYVVVAAPVQDFAAYRLSGRDLDVESSDPGVIGAWFEERLTFELPRVNASIAGFDLVGGRL
ncbi:MAG: zf-HC2 domain-containing protein, partial [Pseudomonadota bacterium]